MPTIQDILQGNINRVAETQFAIRPMMVNRLKQQIITEDGKKHVGNFDNYHQAWIASFNDKFFDMGTFIRLGSVIEGNLKAYYMHKKNYANNLKLLSDPKYKDNIFQRVQPWQLDNALTLYSKELNFDLSLIPQLPKIQELILHRHLFAHSSGLINDKYIKNLKIITGIDLYNVPYIQSSYPAQDCYWFEPLERLGDFIEESRRFFRHFVN